MARTRTTKAVAQRIDLNYFKRATPFKRAKLWLAILAPVVALVWIGWHFFGHDHRVYSSGRLSGAHAVLEKQCAACHVQQAGGFSAAAADSACLACHDGPAHHETAARTEKLACAECHVEHRGRVNLAATGNQSCAQCHGNPPKVMAVTSSTFAHAISSFGTGHPEFAVLRAQQGTMPVDDGTIKVNHALHMKLIRRGPDGPIVQLDCGDCHRTAASGDRNWTYSHSHYVAADQTPPAHSLRVAKPRFPEIDNAVWDNRTVLQAARPRTGRELMTPPRFANACVGCHSLAFDKRFDDDVPHDKPEVVHAFLIKRYSDYIAAHPKKVLEARDVQRLPSRPVPTAATIRTPGMWVAEQVAAAEELLWRKTCAQCHAVLTPLKAARWETWDEETGITTPMTKTEIAAAQRRLPTVLASNIAELWLPHARFDHDAHRGFSCAGCHQNALKSTETSDILIPGIAVCQTCHAPGAGRAESRCFECHTYHDWAKRKEVKPTFVLPGLVKRGN
jgi:hypothetical protein